MTQPSPAIQYIGVGVVGADQYNTYVQVCLNYAQMRTFTGLSNMAVLALGGSTPADGGQGIYYWNATSTAPDNNSTVIVPSGSTQGAWLLDATSVATVALSGITGLGSGVAGALALATSSGGGLVLFNGALGTPSSATLTNATGLPIASGVSGLGTGAAAALAIAVGSAGALITNGGVLGTPSSGTLTNATGLPISSGVSGLGTNVATAAGHATNSGSGLLQLTAGAVVPQATLTSPAVSGSVVSAPVAPASTSTYAMQGLAGSITPATTGRILITISGTIVAPTGTTVDNGIAYQISYGTGSAPANAASLTGTQIGAAQQFTLATAATAAADVSVPFSISYPVTGLTVSTAYWIDLAAKSITTVSQMGLSNVNVVAVEL